MTAPTPPLTSCPWDDAVTPAAPASPSTVVVAVLALADLPGGRAVVAAHLPRMGDAVLAGLGLHHGDVVPGRGPLPLTFLRRPRALLQLARLLDATTDPARHVVDAHGYSLAAARDALVADDGPHAGAMFITGVVPTTTRAGALS